MRINPGRVAIAQLCSTSNKFENLINVAKCAGWAKKEGACMLLLPECFGFLGENSEQTLKNAEPPILVSTPDSWAKKETYTWNEGEDEIMSYLRDTVDTCSNDCITAETTTRLPEIMNDALDNKKPPNKDGEDSSRISLLDGIRAIARASGLWISGGGMHEYVAASPSMDQPKKVYNTHFVLDEKGNVQCKYSKIHLFDVSIPGKVNLQESKTTSAGTKLIVCDSPIGKLGLSTCYDVRFPEMYIDLVTKHGAEVLLVPSAFTVPTGKAHWHILLRARAIENQCYVLAAAQVGRHNLKRESYGHAIAIDPWGEILKDAGGSNYPCIITCDIDHEQVLSVRERMPIHQHRNNSSWSD